MVRSMVQRCRPSRWRPRCPCGRCGAGCRAVTAIAAGGGSRIPCRHGACRACVDEDPGGTGSAVCLSRGGSGPGCRGRWRPRSRRTGQTGPLGDQVDLRAVLAPVDRIRTCQVPFSGPACSPSRSRTATSPAHRGSRVRRGPGGAACPPGLRPLREPPVGGRPGRAERRRRQLLPGTTRRGHEHDRGQHLPVAVPTPTTTLRPRRRLRHHPLEQLPQLVRHQPLNDPHHDPQNTEPPKCDGL